ncbi:MAG TPA: hypoxanthine phosphoribosyltransferase [Kofleriaceae bacterium]
MSNPIISIESMRKFRLQNTRFLRATSISVGVSPIKELRAGSRSCPAATISPLLYIPFMATSPPAWNRDPEPFAELISAEAIAARVAELGAQITADYRDKQDVVVIGVLKGSVIFLADLVRHIGLAIRIEFIGISSYGDATVSSGVVQITQDVSRPVEGKHVIVVEDIVDTGHTVHYLLENLATRRPASIRLASLLHKPERQERAVKIDYLGFTIPNKFVVGYGLDIAQQYRNLPFIGHVV